MTLRSHIALLATYNAWMNARLYDSCAKLSPADLALDRKAFFGSLLGTLNHLVVTDTIWLKRFAAHPANHAALDPVRSLPAPTALNQILFTDFAALAAHRKMLDEVISRWAESLTDEDLAHSLHYTNMRGVVAQRSFASLLFHFFNHQTHHRGQATTLLSQAGQDVGATDLLVLIANELDA